MSLTSINIPALYSHVVHYYCTLYNILESHETVLRNTVLPFPSARYF